MRYNINMLADRISLLSVRCASPVRRRPSWSRVALCALLGLFIANAPERALAHDVENDETAKQAMESDDAEHLPIGPELTEVLIKKGISRIILLDENGYPYSYDQAGHAATEQVTESKGGTLKTCTVGGRLKVCHFDGPYKNKWHNLGVHAGTCSCGT